MYFNTVPTTRKKVAQKLSLQDEWSTYWWAKKKLSAKRKKKMNKKQLLMLRAIIKRFQERMETTSHDDKSMRARGTSEGGQDIAISA